MRNNLLLKVLLLFFFVNFQTNAQNLVQEISMGIGPVSFRGDYGERKDSETNLGNTGFGISFSHYLNFAYDSNSETYFKTHFKLRTQVIYQNINLEHFGSYADGSSEGAAKLRAMTGKVNAFEIGTGLLWYYKNIIDYERNFKILSPYAGLGVGAVFSSPSNDTSLSGDLGSETNTFPTFLAQSGEENPISNDSESALAVNFQFGTQYRLTKNSDIFAELRWHFYTSDFVDGLSPVGNQNESNDWSVWLSLGYVYYFDSL
jgi:hypothetical protein